MNVYDLPTTLAADPLWNICLSPGEQWTLGQRDFSSTERGQRRKWPADFPREEPISGMLVFYVTRDEVDLRDLSRKRKSPRGRAMSRMQSLAYGVAYPEGHEFEPK